MKSNKVSKVIHIMLGMSIMLLFTFEAQVLAMGHAVIVYQEQYYCTVGTVLCPRRDDQLMSLNVTYQRGAFA